VSLAINSSARPAFRAYSTGGVNSAGMVVSKDPDLESVPSGGFNPNSTPPGAPSPSADNVFHIGQLDLVTRVSRGHSVWIDSGSAAPDYVAVVTELAASTPGTALVVEVRGADGFVGSPTAPFDAAALDAYGDLGSTQVLFHDGQAGWSTQVDAIDGARYFQVRLGFEGDVETGATAELAGLGVVFVP
jgi:hypothetical protein